MKDLLNFGTRIDKKIAPSINFHWKVKKQAKRTLSPELQRLLEKIWGKDEKQHS